MLDDSLLYTVFDYLRRHGVPIGVSEYVVAMETVRDCAMLEDLAHLKRLCRLLWTKSQEDQELLEVAFAHFVEPRLQQAPATEPSELTPDPTEHNGEDKPPPPKPERSPVDEPSGPEPTASLDDINRVMTPAKPAITWTDAIEVSGRPYQLTPRYSMGIREMATAWRHLRKLQRSGPPEILDVEATLDEICRTGVFLRPALRPRRRNQAQLVLFIDQGGSMTPFAPLVEVLVSSIQRGGMLGRISCYYFHDCPEGVLYTQPALTEAQFIDEILKTQASDASVLIVSDAGAARGYYDGQRVQATRTFLKTLSAYTYTCAWLSPLPASRWMATTAEDVAMNIPMFPLNRDGLNDAVAILRGHPFILGASAYVRKNT